MSRVMEDYAMQEAGEISLPRGGIINVYEIIDDEWARGELNGKIGRYPVKYVEDIDMPGRPDLGKQQSSDKQIEHSTSPPKGGFKLAAFGVKQGGIGSLLAGGFPGLKKTGFKSEAKPSVAGTQKSPAVESPPAEKARMVEPVETPVLTETPAPLVTEAHRLVTEKPSRVDETSVPDEPTAPVQSSTPDIQHVSPPTIPKEVIPSPESPVEEEEEVVAEMQKIADEDEMKEETKSNAVDEEVDEKEDVQPVVTKQVEEEPEVTAKPEVTEPEVTAEPETAAEQVDEPAKENTQTSEDKSEKAVDQEVNKEVKPGKAIVLHPYNAENEDELSILRGEYVNILDRSIDDGWWKGTNESGKTGIFPCSYVKELSDMMPPARPVGRPTTVQPTSSARPISVLPTPPRPASVQVPIASKPHVIPPRPTPRTPPTVEEPKPTTDEEIENSEEKKPDLINLPTGPKLTTPSRVRPVMNRGRKSNIKEPSQTEILQKEILSVKEEEKKEVVEKKEAVPPVKPMKPIFAKFATPFIDPSKVQLKPVASRKLWEEEDQGGRGVKDIASRFNLSPEAKMKKEFEGMLNEEREKRIQLESVVQDLLKRIEVLEQRQ
ncbi:hypothetical protein BDB01DRAFT_787576 [Pilobolus umbonatus]|nr:hypothetical protein BDB01DRAFT_787576 [Pilobolus umbonatus]